MSCGRSRVPLLLTDTSWSVTAAFSISVQRASIESPEGDGAWSIFLPLRALPCGM
jgi:hypothetical protein